MVLWSCAKRVRIFENVDLLAHIQWCVMLARFYCKCLLHLLNNLSIGKHLNFVAESRQPVLWLWRSADRLRMSMHRIHMHFNCSTIPHSSISSSWPCVTPSCYCPVWWLHKIFFKSMIPVQFNMITVHNHWWKGQTAHLPVSQAKSHRQQHWQRPVCTLEAGVCIPCFCPGRWGGHSRWLPRESSWHGRWPKAPHQQRWRLGPQTRSPPSLHLHKKEQKRTPDNYGITQT